MKTCCCLSGSLSLTRAETDRLHVQASFDGKCAEIPAIIDTTIAMPPDFTQIAMFFEQPLVITLSQDSRELVFTNLVAPQCGGKATRKSSGAPAFTAVPWILVMTVSGLGLSK